jgi:hypothetical protein
MGGAFVTSNVQAETPGLKLSSWQALAGIIDRPRSTLRAVGEQPRHRWLLPLILMIVGIACWSVVSAPYIAQEAAKQMQKQVATMSPEQAEAVQAQMETFASPVFLGVTTAVSRLLVNLLLWALFAGVLYFVGLVAGGEATYGQVFAIVSWGWVPYVLRDFVQAGYTFANGQLIKQSGLSALVATGNQAEDTANYLYAALAQADIFLLWHLLLIGLGLAALNRFGRGKTLFVVVIYLLIVLGVALIPSLIASFVPGGRG